MTDLPPDEVIYRALLACPEAFRKAADELFSRPPPTAPRRLILKVPVRRPPPTGPRKPDLFAGTKPT